MWDIVSNSMQWINIYKFSPEELVLKVVIFLCTLKVFMDIHMYFNIYFACNLTFPFFSLSLEENNGDCVAATSGIVAGLWQVKNCTTRNDFLCERVRGGYTPPPTVTQPINPTAPSDSNCAEGWIGYANKCFKVQLQKVKGKCLWI